MDLLWQLFDFILHIDQYLSNLSGQYGAWIYGILFLIVFAETGLVVTPFLPGDSLLFAAGSLAAVGQMNIYMMMGLLIVAAIVGDAVNFACGRYLGQRLFRHPNSRIFKQEYLHKTEAFYEKYGAKTIVIARFVPIVRTFAPFVAGMGNMNYVRFVIYNVVGAVCWVLIFSYLGYFFGNLEIVRKNLALVLVGIIFISFLPILIEWVKHKYRR